MRNYKTPGVYVEEKSVLPGSVAGVSTAIPAFIGYTEKAGINNELINQPTKISTLKEYEELFGITSSESIEVFVKTGESEAGAANHTITCTMPTLPGYMYYSMQMFFDNGGGSCYIVSVAKGEPALDNFKAALNSLQLEDEPTLLVLVDGVTLSDNDYHALCVQALSQCNEMKDRFAVFDVKESQDSKVEDDALTFRNGCGTNYLKYGAAYYPFIKTVLKYQYIDDSVNVKIDENDSVLLSSIREGQTDLYNKIKKEIVKHSITLPPASSVAGIYASVDRDRGVWKAPANVSISSVIGPTKKMTEEENDGLNIDPETGKSINAIRNFSGKGTLLWGARTLAGNDNEWRYIPVRRLFNYVEESIQKATAFAVFEPNTAMTWLKLRSMVESFLDTLWRQGALAGGKEEDAYFVQVGLGTTMTTQDILEGRLIIKVGLAAVRPAEFIILEFTHKVQES